MSIHDVAKAVLVDLDAYVQAVRNDWSLFDGRENRTRVNEIVAPLREVLDKSTETAGRAPSDVRCVNCGAWCRLDEHFCSHAAMRAHAESILATIRENTGPDTPRASSQPGAETAQCAHGRPLVWIKGTAWPRGRDCAECREGTPTRRQRPSSEESKNG